MWMFTELLSFILLIYFFLNSFNFSSIEGSFMKQIPHFHGNLYLFARMQMFAYFMYPSSSQIAVFKWVTIPLITVCSISGWMQEISWRMMSFNCKEDGCCGTLWIWHNSKVKNQEALSLANDGAIQFFSGF